jgi:hypothetical protein
MKAFDELAPAVRRFERAKAVGILCNMIARKITLDRDDDADSDECVAERVEAPREIPSDNEWRRRPRRVEKAELDEGDGCSR